MANQSDQKVALITGAGARIGHCMAASLHAQGFNVVVHYHRSADAAEALVTELNQQRSNSAIAVQANLLEQAELASLAIQARDHWQRLDLLVNNASSYYPSALNELSDAAWDDLLGSNLKAPLWLASHCRQALAQQQGCIINIIDSNVLSRPIADHAIYNAAKAALHGLTLSLAKDLAPEVRVNGIAPGAIMWAANERDEKQQAEIIEATALGRLGRAEDIANAVLFLAEASYITGHVMKVDGGKNIR
jgi:pteridine reductase